MAENTQSPSPYVFPPSQIFHGNDGLWSTFVMRIGTPAQDFYVLPSTNGDTVVIPLVEGCINSPDNITAPPNCGSLRGAISSGSTNSSGFDVQESDTWKSIGIFQIQVGQQWGINVYGQYGYETVGLAVQNSGGPTLNSQVVAGIARKQLFLGVFPLDIWPVNFSTFDNPQSSFSVNLQDRGVILGLGFGYTAGAHYRNTGVTANLVLGGYDAARYDANKSKTFAFGPDDSHDFTVGVQNIILQNTLNGTVSPLLNGITASIDSTLPYLWLPGDACDIFESAFGLTYDNDSALYLVNDTSHALLKNLNPTVSLTLGDGTMSGTGEANSVVIELPYAAFDLQASWPLVDNQTKYFPLKRAANSTQYTLGRAFLQEAYLGVDYERRIFNVSQARFTSPMPDQKVVPILPINATGRAPPRNSSHISVSAKVGLAISISATILILLLLGFIYIRHRQRLAAGYGTKEPSPNDGFLCDEDDAKEAASEQIFEVHDHHRPHEADSVGSQVHELPGSSCSPVEMPHPGRETGAN